MGRDVHFTVAYSFHRDQYVLLSPVCVVNECLPCDAWQRVSGEEGKRRFLPLQEPYGVLSTLLGVKEHRHVQATGTLPPPQPRAQHPGAAKGRTVHPEELT